MKFRNIKNEIYYQIPQMFQMTIDLKDLPQEIK
jgi:hypothetical protein